MKLRGPLHVSWLIVAAVMLGCYQLTLAQTSEAQTPKTQTSEAQTPKTQTRKPRSRKLPVAEVQHYENETLSDLLYRMLDATQLKVIRKKRISNDLETIETSQGTVIILEGRLNASPKIIGYPLRNRENDILISFGDRLSLPPSYIFMSGLEGLKEVGVSLSLDDDVKKAGVTEQEIRNQAELRLRQAGLKVNEEAPEHLNVNIDALTIDVFYFLTIEIELEEPAYLERLYRGYPISPFLDVTTWRTGTLLAFGKSYSPRQKIRETLVRQLDEFLNEWYKANEK